MSDQITPSRSRKRRRFLFDEVENNISSEENDNFLVGTLPRGQLIYSETFVTVMKQDNDCDEDEAELANTTATNCKTFCGVSSEGNNCFANGNEMHTNPVVSSLFSE